MELLAGEMETALMSFFFTSTAAAAATPRNCAVIWADPGPTDSSVPSVATRATAVSEDVHEAFVAVMDPPLESVAEAVRRTASPCMALMASGDTESALTLPLIIRDSCPPPGPRWR